MPSWIFLLIAGVLIFMMMRGGCGGHVSGHGRHGGRSDDRSRGHGWTPPAQDTDPVCGMTVDTKTAKSAIHAGTAYYFCSQECRDKFEASPASYAHGGGATPQEMEHQHG